MHNREIAHFQGQIETALKKFREELDLRMKNLFAKLRIQSHLTAAGIRKCEGYSPLHLLFVLTKVVFLHIATGHDLLTRPLRSFVKPTKIRSTASKRPNGVGERSTAALCSFWGGAPGGLRAPRITA